MKKSVLLLPFIAAISIPLWVLADGQPDEEFAKMREAAIAAYNNKIRC